jgi:hypothetical protein
MKHTWQTQRCIQKQNPYANLGELKQASPLTSRGNLAQHSVAKTSKLESENSPDKALKLEVERSNDFSTQYSSAKFDSSGIQTGIIVPDSGKSYDIPRPTTKAEEMTSMQFIQTVLTEIPLFKDVNDAKKDQLIESMSRESFTTSSTIFPEDGGSNKFFVILYGQVHLLDQNGDIVKKCLKGDTFGTLELIWKTKRLLTAIAETDVMCITFHRTDYEKIWKKHFGCEEYNAAEFLRGLPVFRNCSDRTLACVFYKAIINDYSSGCVLRADEWSSNFLPFLLRGECQVIIHPNSTKRRTVPVSANVAMVSPVQVGQYIGIHDFEKFSQRKTEQNVFVRCKENMV